MSGSTTGFGFVERDTHSWVWVEHDVQPRSRDIVYDRGAIRDPCGSGINLRHAYTFTTVIMGPS